MSAMKLMYQDKKHQWYKCQKHDQSDPGTLLDLSFVYGLDNDANLFQLLFFRIVFGGVCLRSLFHHGLSGF